MSNHKKPENDNAGIHISRIIGQVPCYRHGADVNEACWNLGSNQGILKAICDKRARSAGANGQITPYKTNAQIRTQKKEYSR